MLSSLNVIPLGGGISVTFGVDGESVEWVVWPGIKDGAAVLVVVAGGNNGGRI